MVRNEKPRTIKLLCPSVSNKAVPFLAWDDQKLDLGSIARSFGIHPSTLKLNGHFISRGVDLVSSSVTWRSLINFFKAKGLSTGAGVGNDDQDAIFVDGKLCKSGTKRGHDLQDAAAAAAIATRVNCRPEPAQEVGISRGPRSEDVNNLIMNKKLKEINSGCEDGHQVSKFNGLGFKRKQTLEDVNLLKKLKINEGNLGHFPDVGSRGNNYPSISSSSLKCSYMNASMKRSREDEAIIAASCKRIK